MWASILNSQSTILLHLGSFHIWNWIKLFEPPRSGLRLVRARSVPTANTKPQEKPHRERTSLAAEGNKEPGAPADRKRHLCLTSLRLETRLERSEEVKSEETAFMCRGGIDRLHDVHGAPSPTGGRRERTAVRLPGIHPQVQRPAAENRAKRTISHSGTRILMLSLIGFMQMVEGKTVNQNFAWIFSLLAIDKGFLVIKLAAPQ